MPTTGTSGTTATSEAAASARLVLLVAFVLTLPLALERILWASPGAFDSTERVALVLFDLPQLGLLVLWGREGGARRAVERVRRGDVLGCLAAVLAVLLVTSVVVHPSWRGLETLVRIATAIAVVDGVKRMDRRQGRILLAAIVVSGCSQAIFAIAQHIHGDLFGISVLEHDNPGVRYGDDLGARGSLFHGYALAGFCLVAIGAATIRLRTAIHPRPWLVCIALCAAAVATSFSRAALLGVLPALVVAFVSSRERRPVSPRWVAAAMAIGLLVGAASASSGWAWKADVSGSTASVDSGRRDKIQEALGLAGRSPVVGIGLGNYVIELREVEPRSLQHAHNVPLHLAAEAGFAAGLASAVLFAVVALRVARNGPTTQVVFCLFAPFWLVDAYPLVYPVGMAIAAVWCATLVLARADAPISGEGRWSTGVAELAA